MKTYIQKIRSKLGSEKFIHPAARIIVENARNQILIIERTDNGKLGLPAGAFEEGETIEACITREVFEETGIRIRSLQVIGISSNPQVETVKYPNGDEIQYFTVEFYSDDWEGRIGVQDKNEVKRAVFMDWSVKEQLPKNELSAFESLEFYRTHHKIMLK